MTLILRIDHKFDSMGFISGDDGEHKLGQRLVSARVMSIHQHSHSVFDVSGGGKSYLTMKTKPTICLLVDTEFSLKCLMV